MLCHKEGCITYKQKVVKAYMPVKYFTALGANSWLEQTEVAL